MNLILIFVLGMVAGGVAIKMLGKKNNLSLNPSPSLGEGKAEKASLIEKQAEEKRRNKEAILGLLETEGRLTNNHIEQMLGISDATATRYLEELEKGGFVRQVGTTGQHVYYERV